MSVKVTKAQVAACLQLLSRRERSALLASLPHDIRVELKDSKMSSYEHRLNQPESHHLTLDQFSEETIQQQLILQPLSVIVLLQQYFQWSWFYQWAMCQELHLDDITLLENIDYEWFAQQFCQQVEQSALPFLTHLMAENLHES